MVKVKDDLTGRIFGRLLVLKQADDYVHPNGSRRARWLCECSCEERNKIVVAGDRLKKKNGTRSCGCLQKESLILVHESKKKTNEYDLSGEYGIGWTSNTNQEFYFDLEDYDKIKDYCWFELIDRAGYHSLYSYDPNTKCNIKMHWILVGKNYDHANRLPLDNRKANLRIATFEENTQNRNKRSDNTSGIIGVSWDDKKQKWIARISVHKKRICLGTFANKIDAITARLEAESQYYKEFAPQRHLFDVYNIQILDKERLG